ncbi:uncharacterized protein LOC118803140 isoform X2 [Colossoma macropomum]|uniref:uncharacterized protein LOC118803140 isoform X2 n=1 Tax=Colossoma macropomum TaxID=42526 RepID=UPI0018643D77|nr:uncharacterized protein LOC118803140 isoform X2 [Colossoma macropomum]
MCWVLVCLAVFLCVWGDVSWAVMFSLSAFISAPSVEQFEQCRKADLLQLAEHYDIGVDRNVRKAELKSSIFGVLVARGILFEGPCPVSEGAGAVEEVSLAARAEAGVGAVPPRIDPVRLPAVGTDPALILRLKELELQRQLNRALEIEAERAVKLRQLELEAGNAGQPVPAPRNSAPPLFAATPAVERPVPSPRRSVSFRPYADEVAAFDVSKHIKLVPKFRESEVDSYFVAFERVATTLRWPQGVWPILLQCTLVGKAQEVYSALPIEESLDYEVVKSAVLRAYELVPEAYRQNYRAHSKTANQTYVEFAREKRHLFNKWCNASQVFTFDQLQELMLLEDFKSCLPENLVVYLNEQKFSSLADAAVAADEFALTHKSTFPVLARNETTKSRTFRSSLIWPWIIKTLVKVHLRVLGKRVSVFIVINLAISLLTAVCFRKNRLRLLEKV